MWEFWKKQGGSTRIPLPFFTVFNMGDPPTINVPKVLKCKINQTNFNMTFPNRGEGVPDLGKIPTFSRYFSSANVPYSISILALLHFDLSLVALLHRLLGVGGRGAWSLTVSGSVVMVSRWHPLWEPWPILQGIYPMPEGGVFLASLQENPTRGSQREANDVHSGSHSYVQASLPPLSRSPC